MLVDLESSRDREGSAMTAELIARRGRERSVEPDRRARTDVSPGRSKEVDRSNSSLGKRARGNHRVQGPGGEVAILADRSDISEEVVRLRAHIKQYSQIIEEPVSSGRKLEFVVQEMGREINTIGSKANDIEISRFVVEINALLEKVRELIQNVE